MTKDYLKKEKKCEDCKKESEELKRLGYSFSTSTSMVSSFEGVELCSHCGKELV